MQAKLISIALFCVGMACAQTTKTEVLTLGSFHFAFHNLDVVKIEKGDQIDVLEEKYQVEIQDIVDRLAAFHPTVIVIERTPKQQGRIDSLYQAYLSGQHVLSRNEEEQIGFRLARKMGVEKLYCVDDPGMNYHKVDQLMQDPAAEEKFIDFFYKNPDSTYFFNRPSVFKSKGIRAELIETNRKDKLSADLGNYLIGSFKYETDDDPDFGVDFTSGWWFNRNLRIFRNIQRIETKPDDRILVIFGSGHMNLLNIFFESSPEYELRSVIDYLE